MLDGKVIPGDRVTVSAENGKIAFEKKTDFSLK
jgi:hypothetical protein